MNKYLTAFIVALIVLLGGYYLIKGTKTQPATSTSVLEDQSEPAEKDELLEEQEIETTEAMTEDKEEDKGEDEKEEDSNVKTFNLDAVNFSYSIKEIRVKKGTTVKINLVRKQGFHDLVIEEFNARTKQLGEGSKDSLEFVANKTGTFEYYCSVGQHRQQGMVGQLIVE